VLLQRSSVLWQPTSARDDHDLWPHAVEVRLPDHAQTTAGQVSCREGQNAAGKADTRSHTLSTVDVRFRIVFVDPFIFSAHSKNELMQWRGVCRLSVHPSVCPSVNFCANRFSQTNGRIATKLAHDGLRVSMHPGCAQGQGQRSRDTGTFVWHKNGFFSQANGWIATKLAHDGLQVSLHPWCSQGQRSRDMHTFLDSWNELLRHWRSG